MPFPPSIKPDPDIQRLLKVLRRQGEPDRVPFYELFADGEIMAAALEHPLGEGKDYWDSLIEYQYRMGYDYVAGTLDGFLFPQKPNRATEDTAGLSRGTRAYYTEDVVTIATREDYDCYGWPDPDNYSLNSLEYIAEHAPEGMGILGHVPGGVLEHVMWLCGYTGLSYMLADDPELARRIFDRTGEILVRIAERYAHEDAIHAVVMGDDMGHKTGTMFSPEMFREYVFPWHRRIVEAVHAADKPFILHACGNLELVMDDIIDYARFDAKHSFEDVILPVPEAKKKWGGRIALLGGIDVDVLCRATEEEVRDYVRRTLEQCMPGGGWALGSGNTVTNYIPLENVLAMLDEGWQAGRY